MEVVERGTLIEERVISTGGAVLDAYRTAQAGEVFVNEGLDLPAFANKQTGYAFQVPRIDEAWVDGAVRRAGGFRIEPCKDAGRDLKTADYRINDVVFELKDLQQEGLEVPGRQDRIAALLGSCASREGVVTIDADTLPETEWNEYKRLVAEQIGQRVRDASKQVRATLERENQAGLRGGVILVNSGYGTLTHAELREAADRAICRSSVLEVAICFSVSVATNGSDYCINCKFSPEDDSDVTTTALREAFLASWDESMDSWAKGAVSPTTRSAVPLEPITFERDGVVYVRGAGLMQTSLSKE